MNDQNELIQFRLERAEEAFDVAKFSVQKKYWNTAASKLYYTCFYTVLALFAKYNIQSTTHSGAKVLFALHFIKEGKIDAKWGRLLQTLFDKRQEGDYGDFLLIKEEEIIPLIEQVEEFRQTIKEVLKK